MPSRYGRRVERDEADPEVISKARALTPLECIQQASKLLLTSPEAIGDEEAWFIQRLSNWQAESEHKAAMWAATRYAELVQELIEGGQFIGALELAAERLVNEIHLRYKQGHE